MSQCIKELSLDDRPREKLMQQGAAGLSNSELLAILIRTGTQKRSALRIAEELTSSSGLYQNIACVHSVAELAKVKGLGPAKAATILAALELGKRIAAAWYSNAGANTSRGCTTELLTDPSETCSILMT